MGIRSMLNINKADNKFDMAIRSFYLIFYTAGFIVFLAVGLNSMNIKTWILAFLCSIFGATVYGTIAKMIINMVRKDKQVDKLGILKRLFYVILFSLATVAFLAIGLEEKTIKTWIIAFVGSYGGAIIFSSIAQLIITLAKKDK